MYAREAELGVERVYVDDVRFTYALTGDTPEKVVGGALTWRYDGQQVFTDDPAELPTSVVRIEPDYVLTGPEYDPEEYYAFTRIDKFGRRWVVDGVDLVAIAEQMAVDSLEREPMPGDATLDWLLEGDAGPDGILGIEFNPEAGAVSELELTSWTKESCDGTTTSFTQHDTNGDLEEFVTAGGDLGPAAQWTVQVSASGERCSGALVATNAVLTAAHCVTDGNAVAYPVSAITVCPLENLQVNERYGTTECVGAEHIHTATGWSVNPYALEKDWAIVFLEERLEIGEYTGTGSSSVDWRMQITPGPDSAWENHVDFLRGYPVWDGTCAANEITNDCLRADHREVGRELYGATGTVAATPVGSVRWETSIGQGVSGAAHFYCPTGDCNDSALITGLQTATFNLCPNVVSGACATGFAVGPKGSNLRVGLVTALFGYAANPGLPPRCTGLWEPYDETPRLLIPAENMSPDTCGPMGKAPGSTACDLTVVSEPSPAVHPDKCSAQDELVLYLPGTGFGPKDNKYPQDMAAQAGFKTIGLSYVNSYSTNKYCKDRSIQDSTWGLCAPSPLDYAEECNYFIREERITGVDHPGTYFDEDDPLDPNDPFDPDPVWDLAEDFDLRDSIAYRLLWTLAFLDGPSGSDCSYHEFYVPPGGGEIEYVMGRPQLDGTFPPGTGPVDFIQWDQIIVGGWSQGAGQATLISLEHQVAGLFLLDGQTDMCRELVGQPDTDRGATYYDVLTDSIFDPIHRSVPRFGVWHQNSGAVPEFPLTDNRPVSWDNDVPDDPNALDADQHDGPVGGLRLPICDDQDWDIAVGERPVPIVHVTDHVEWGPFMDFPGMTIETAMARVDDPTTPADNNCGPHESVALSSGSADPGLNCMPMAATGGVAAATADQAHVYEAYVGAFCELGK